MGLQNSLVVIGSPQIKYVDSLLALRGRAKNVVLELEAAD